MKAGANCFKFNGKLSCWIATPLLLYLRVHWSGIRSSRHFRFRPQEVDHSVLNQPRNCHNTKQCFKQNKYTLCSILRCKDCPSENGSHENTLFLEKWTSKAFITHLESYKCFSLWGAALKMHFDGTMLDQCHQKKPSKAISSQK